MSQELNYIYNEKEILKNKKQKEGKLSEPDRVYLKLLERALNFIKNHLLTFLFENVMDDRSEEVQVCGDYFNREIERYTSRLNLLTENKKTSAYSRSLDKKIEKCKEKLDVAISVKGKFDSDKASLISKHSRIPVGKELRILFETPINGSFMLNSTRLGNTNNDFLKIDEVTGERRLNRANAHLFIDVYSNHNLDNLKRLATIRDINANKIYQLNKNKLK